MRAYTYIEHGKFGLSDKPVPELTGPRDAVVRVTLCSICTSDLHIKHGSVPRAVPGITVGHEMVGVVEQVGAEVASVKVGDRVTVNVETFCGECFFCRRGYVNNCTDPEGGWALGCRIDGGQAEYVRVPYADRGLNRIPDTVSDEQALFVGDNGGGYGTGHRGGAYGAVHLALRDAEEAEARHRLRKFAGKSPFREGALSRCAGDRLGRVPGFRASPQRPWRGRCGAGSGWRNRYVPVGVGVCTSQRRRHGCRAL